MHSLALNFIYLYNFIISFNIKLFIFYYLAIFLMHLLIIFNTL